MQLAYHGCLALLLDGRNELDPASLVAATHHLIGATIRFSGS
jgi:hypothetical protein